MEMQLAVFITGFLASVPLPSFGETIGHVTRDYFGDIFTLGDCEPGSCDLAGRRAAQIPGERCRCQCAPSHYTFREDMRQCIKDVGECPVAMFVRPFAVERIPLVFLPMTGQLVYPGAHLTVSGIARLAPSRHLSCNVKSSLLMTSHGWQPIRTPSSIFGVYYDGNKTFLQWLGDDEDRRKLQHHLVLIRLACEGENSNGTFEPCAALRIGWAPGLETDAATAESAAGKNNYVIIGLCLGILGLIYVGAVLIYLKVRKGRRSGSRQGLAPSRTTMESNDEEEANVTSQTRSAYINNLVQEAELTSKKSSSKGGVLSAPENGHVSSIRVPQSSEASSSGSPSGVQLTNNPLYEKQASNDSTDSPSASPAQPASPEFFLRIRSMIAAAKNRLNSFRYRPTLLVIPEDDYFYQDFKERDIDVTNGDKKSIGRRLASKGSKMESIHGSHLGAAMLGAKVAPPLPPPRQVKCKSKKKAPSPPGKRNNYPLTDRYESASPQNREVSGDGDPGPASSSADALSKFDIFRLDLYEKINRIRDGSREQNVENGIIVLDGVEEKNNAVDVAAHETEEIVELYNEPTEIPGKNSQKISRRQLIHKLQESENDNVSPSRENTGKHSNGDVSQRSKPQTPTSTKSLSIDNDGFEQDDDDDWASSHAGSVVEEVHSVTPLPYSRPGTASSNRSLPTSISSAHHTSDNQGRRKSTLRRNGGRRKKHKREREQEKDEERSEMASLSGDSLNSSFRKPSKSPSSMKSKRSQRSVDDDAGEDTSVISASSMVTTSTAIKELQDDYDDDDDDDDDEEEDYDETMDEEDSRFSTDLDPEDFSLDESEHPSLEEYLQLSSQVAKKLSERTVPAFSSNSQREKNVLTQFMKEFKTTIGRLRTADETKPRTTRPPSPGADNWTLRKEEKAKSNKVTRKVSLFKRNPLKSRKHHADELLAEEEHRKISGYYDINAGVCETDDTISCFSDESSLSGNHTKGRSKCKTPEIVPAGKMMSGGEKTIIAITSEDSKTATMDQRGGPLSKAIMSNGVSIPRIGKAVTPPLPPPKPSVEELQTKTANFRKAEMKLRHSPQHDKSSSVSPVPNGDLKSTKVTTLNRKANRSPARVVRTPSFESDSISVANSDMTEDSLNTPIPRRDDRDEEDDDVDEDGPIDRALEQLADSVIQPPDDCSLNRYLSHLGTVLASREDNALDQCLNKLASNMNGSRATKGFNLSQHLPLGTWEHVCVDRITSDRSTPTSDVSSTSRGSRGSQEHLRKKTLTKSKHHHHHHHHRVVECKHGNGHAQDHHLQAPPVHGNHTSNHLTNGRLQQPLAGNDSYTTRIHVERPGHKLVGNNTGRNRITSASEDDTESRASSLGSTRELETPVSETTSDPSSADLERSRKRRPLGGRRTKKGLNGTCRQHIQNSRLGKDGDPRAVRKAGSKQKSGDVTVIQLEGDPENHVTNVESTNTFVTLINVDSSDCSNSAEEK